MARDETKRERNGEKSLLNRRTYLKGAGAAVASLAAFRGASGGAAAAEYETRTVSAGGYDSVTLRDGDTFENVLVDISADGAEFHVDAHGDDWAIRNVGIKGRLDSSGGAPNIIRADGNGVIEHCFFGDIAAPNIGGGAIGIKSYHAGHIDIKECYIGGSTDNGVYAAQPAENNGGTMAIDTCYFVNNNITHIRAAADGTTVKNSVLTNTNDVNPNHKSGSINSRGFWDFYGDGDETVTIENCDIDITDENTNGSATAAVATAVTYEMRNCQVKGQLRGNVTESNVGSSPDTSVPAGVPTTPEDAAAATATGDTSGSGTQTPDQSGDDQPQGTLLELISTPDRANITYEFTVEGTVEKRTSSSDGVVAEANDSVTDNGDGTVTVSGISGNGHGDSYLVQGSITAMDLDESLWTIRYDGAEVGVDDFVLPNKLVIDGSDTPRVQSTYTFSVDGKVEKSGDLGSINAHDTVDQGTISGRVIGGRDGYRFSGEITGFKLDGPASVEVQDGS
ncbi:MULTISPECIES: hypothetical protein [Halorussus]|uniref:hypothetical protein n=1 Tax=Halorussus TaxID=1070314 RepID=UPI000E21430C|nr:MULTISPECIES: hypothetical protein [Halorussus]NHN60557.1 hypothetical protein [Halorussus sp. JP-T4]